MILASRRIRAIKHVGKALGSLVGSFGVPICGAGLGSLRARGMSVIQNTAEERAAQLIQGVVRGKQTRDGKSLWATVGAAHHARENPSRISFTDVVQEVVTQEDHQGMFSTLARITKRKLQVWDRPMTMGSRVVVHSREAAVLMAQRVKVRAAPAAAPCTPPQLSLTRLVATPSRSLPSAPLTRPIDALCCLTCSSG